MGSILLRELLRYPIDPKSCFQVDVQPTDQNANASATAAVAVIVGLAPHNLGACTLWIERAKRLDMVLMIS